MIKDFEVIRSQLQELASVINAFKSEAVQLRIVELVMTGRAAGADATPHSPSPSPLPPPRRKRKRTPTPGDTAEGASLKAPRAPAKGRPGGKAMLDRLVADGFFKQAKAIGQIVDHCDTDLAMKFIYRQRALRRSSRSSCKPRDENGGHERARPGLLPPSSHRLRARRAQQGPLTHHHCDGARWLGDINFRRGWQRLDCHADIDRFHPNRAVVRHVRSPSSAWTSHAGST